MSAGTRPSCGCGNAQYGKGKRGDELPAELARRESRLAKIREAKAALEQEAKQKAERQRAEAEAKIAKRREQEAQTGRKAGGHDPKLPDPQQAQPGPKAQRNFTDPDSRIMVDGANKGSFVQAYNAQAAVDSQAQVIVATEITQEANDSKQLAPMIEQTAVNMGRKPEAVSADAGYWSEDNVSGEAVAGMELYIATGRSKHGEPIETATGPPAADASVREAMRHKLRTEAGQAVYKMRKAIVRARLRPDQGATGFSAVQFPRCEQSPRRMENDLPDAQPAQAVSLRLDASNGLNRAIAAPRGRKLAAHTAARPCREPRARC